MVKLVKSDFRNYPRIKISENIDTKIIIGTNNQNVRILDYSFGGFSIESNDLLLKIAKANHNDVTIVYHDQFFKTQIKNLRVQQGKNIIGLGILGQDVTNESISFSDNDSGWDLVNNEETLDNIFSDLAFKNVECLTEIKQLSFKGILIPKEYIKSEHSFIFEIYKPQHGKLIAGRSTYSFELFQTHHYFEGNITAFDDKQIKVKLPKSIARMLRRETVRINSSDLKYDVDICIGDKKFSGKLYDISEHGISILDTEDTDIINLPLGYHIKNISLNISNGVSIIGSCEVRGIRWISDYDCYAIGFKFFPRSYEEKTSWHNFILESRYPNLSFEYEKEDHQKIWDLFDLSGYLDLKSKEAFTHVFDITKKTWKKLSNAGTEISKRAQIKKDDQVIGHLQMDKIYPNTWCVHHLAIDPKTSKIVGKELYSLTADVLSAENATCIFSLTEASKPWNQRNYYNFVNQYRFPDHNQLDYYEVFEADLNKNISFQLSDDIECRFANKYDLKRIKRYYNIFSSQLEREACSYDDGDFLLEKMNQDYQKYGLNRGRGFVVALKKNKMIGFSKYEYGSTGINIFGLFDFIEITILQDAIEYKDNVTEHLIHKTLNVFKDMNKADVVIAIKNPDIQSLEKSGLEYIWKGVRWLAKRETAKRFHSYSQNLYGHILLKRQKIKEKNKKEK